MVKLRETLQFLRVGDAWVCPICSGEIHSNHDTCLDRMCAFHAAAPALLEALEYLSRQPDCSDSLKEFVIAPAIRAAGGETK